MANNGNKKRTNSKASSTPSVSQTSTNSSTGPSSIDSALNWCKTHVTTLKGLAFFMLGAIFIFIARRVLISFGVALLGCMLAYHGLAMLGLTQVTDIIDNLVGKIRR